MGCFVCSKHAGEIEMPGGVIFSDDLVFVSHGKLDDRTQRVYPGLFFIEPKRHVDGLADLTEDEAQRVGLVASWLARALRECAEATRVYSAVAGHHVAHLHMWIVPRYAGAPEGIWGIDLALHPSSPRADEAELQPICDRVRDHVSQQAHRMTR